MVTFGFFILLALVERVSACVDDQCRELEFPGYYFFYGERLINHLIRTIKVLDQDSCELQCYLEHNCVSINFEFTGTHNCDLNNATHKEHEKDLVKKEGYVYHGTKNACGKAPCQNNATCQTGFTSKRYRCLCNRGFTGDNCEFDIDECKDIPQICDLNAVCNNTKGSYQCTCKTGFTGNGHNCKDIDECKDIPQICDLNAVCNNTKGSYQCTCKTGFTGNGHNCTDFDECKDIPQICDLNAVCNNTKGSYQCTCKTGFTGNGHNCTDIDECKDIPQICDLNAVCNNTKGSYQCTCKTGFTGNGHNCTDIDECKDIPQICDLNAVCNNTKGSYQCTCKAGFTRNGHNCTDIDECKDVPQICDLNAVCNNTKGSYQCRCKAGFTGKGHNCTDIDECSQGSNKNCSEHAHCNNTAGSYKCTCSDGYFGDGQNCTPVFIINSTILSNNRHYLHHLHHFLAPEVGNISQWLLCYRQSLDGDYDFTFHDNCDGKENTVTIVKEKEFVFGGYTDIPWESNRTHESHKWFGSTSKAFIFSLNNKEQLAPFKSMVKEPERAIYNHRWYGPTFGKNDIRIDKGGSTGHSHSITNFGNDYFVPENVNDTKTILAGVYRFHPDEVEVFYLN